MGGYLANPSQTVFQNIAGQQSPIAANDDWWSSPQSEQMSALNAQLGVFELGGNAADSALLRLVESGSFTSIVSGVGGTTGIVLTEIYDANKP